MRKLKKLFAFYFLLMLPNIVSAQYISNQVADLGYGRGKFNFLNETVGYHFSLNGISKTTDGGETWDEFITHIQDFTHPEGLYLSGQFVSETEGYVVLRTFDPENIKDSSFLYKTIDGGTTWDLKRINPPNDVLYGAAEFGNVYFKNPMEGWIFGDGLLEHTIDGGENWITILHNEGDTHNNDVMRAMCFSNDETAYIVGYGAWIQKSEDNGVTWEDQHYNGEIGTSDDYYIHDIAFANDNIGYAAVGHGILKKTINGGELWQEIYTGYPDDNNAVFVDPYNTVWLGAGDYCDDTGCYYTSKLLYSLNEGLTWNTLIEDAESTSKFTDVVWPSPNYGFACNDIGHIYKITREDLGLNDLTSDRKPIYPNPSTDIINIDNSGEFHHLEITNLQGQVIIESKGSALSVNQLANGVYWVNIYNMKNDIIDTEKLVKF